MDEQYPREMLVRVSTKSMLSRSKVNISKNRSNAHRLLFKNKTYCLRYNR